MHVCVKLIWIDDLVFCPVTALFGNVEKTTKLYLFFASTAMLNIRSFAFKSSPRVKYCLNDTFPLQLRVYFLIVNID